MGKRERPGFLFPDLSPDQLNTETSFVLFKMSETDVMSKEVETNLHNILEEPQAGLFSPLAVLDVHFDAEETH